LERTWDTSGAVVTVSTNGSNAATLLDGNDHWFWESDGRRGEHWIMITLPNTITSIEAVELCVPRIRNISYLPDKVDIYTGDREDNVALRNGLKITTYGWTACLEKPAPGCVVRFSIKSCHQVRLNKKTFLPTKKF